MNQHHSVHGSEPNLSLQRRPSNTQEQVVLDRFGDVIIEVANKDIRVSAKILSIASPVFDAMFASRFSEGVAARSVETPLRLPLIDDDAQALLIILNALHFYTQGVIQVADENTIHSVALLGDKYDLCAAVYGDTGRWLHHYCIEEAGRPTVFNSNSHFLACEAAFMLDQEHAFEQITGILITKLSKRILESASTFQAFPTELCIDLEKYRSDIIGLLLAETERSIDHLRGFDEVHATLMKVCKSCSRVKPAETKKCGHCDSVVVSLTLDVMHYLIWSFEE